LKIFFFFILGNLGVLQREWGDAPRENLRNRREHQQQQQQYEQCGSGCGNL